MLNSTIQHSKITAKTPNYFTVVDVLTLPKVHMGGYQRVIEFAPIKDTPVSMEGGRSESQMSDFHVSWYVSKPKSGLWSNGWDVDRWVENQKWD